MPESKASPQYMHGGELATYCAARLQSAKAIVDSLSDEEFYGQLPQDVSGALMDAVYVAELLGNEARLTSALEGKTTGRGLRAVKGGK